MRAVILALFLMLTAAPLLADDLAMLNQARADGVIGERPDGLIGFVAREVDAAVVRAVEQANSNREQEYARIAAETDAPLAAVQARAGAQLIARTPPGQFIMTASGQWIKK